jgi:hypothetical protein
MDDVVGADPGRPTVPPPVHFERAPRLSEDDYVVWETLVQIYRDLNREGEGKHAAAQNVGMQRR